MKKLAVKLMTLALTAACVFGFAVDAKAADFRSLLKEYRVSTYAELKDALTKSVYDSSKTETENNQEKEITIVLEKDIKMYDESTNYGMDIPRGKTRVTLDMNGHKMELGYTTGVKPNKETRYLFSVSNTNFIITNSAQKESLIDVWTSSTATTSVIRSVGDTANPPRVDVAGNVRIDMYAVDGHGFIFYPEQDSGYSGLDARVYGSSLSVRGNGYKNSAVMGVLSGGNIGKLTLGANAKIYGDGASITYCSTSARLPDMKFYNCEIRLNAEGGGSYTYPLFVHENYVGGGYKNYQLKTVNGSDSTQYRDSNGNTISNTSEMFAAKGILKVTTTGSFEKDNVFTTTGHLSYSPSSSAVSFSGHAGSWKTDKEASCIAKGSRSIECSTCMYTIKQEIAYKEHSMKYKYYKSASCTADGWTEHTYCSSCGLYYPDEYLFEENVIPGFVGDSTNEAYIVPRYSHTLTKVEAVAPTCLKDGSKEHYTCKYCKNIFLSDADKMSTDYKTEADLVVKATGHSYDEGKVTKQPTETETGIKVYTCKADPNHTKEEVLPALGKKEEPVATPTVGATVIDPVTKASYKVTSVGSKTEASFNAPANKDAIEVVIPDSVSIGGVTYKVTAIAPNAFKSSKVTKLSIGKNVVTIGNNAFKGCKSLKNVTIPASVKKIGKSAFEGCSKLATVKIKTKKLKSSTVGSKAFKSINKKAKVTVPASKFTSYKKMLKTKGINGKNQKIKK